MKKFITLLLAVLMVASLAACGSNSSAPAADGSAEAEAAASSVQLKILDTEYVTEDYAIAVAKENTDLLDSINTALASLKEDGTLDQVVAYYISGEGELPAYQQDVADDAEVLTMACSADFAPYEFHDTDDAGNDVIVGIDPVIAGLIADQLGMKLEITDTDFKAIIPDVVSGKVDFGMSGMTVTDERLETVNFSDSYATGVQVVVVVPEGSPIENVDQLFSLIEDGEDVQIGTQDGTTGYLYSLDDFGDEHVQAFNKYHDAFQALITGKLTCIIMDSAPAEAFIAANNG